MWRYNIASGSRTYERIGWHMPCLFIVLLASSAGAGTLEIGTGAADITPDVNAYSVPLAGYGARLGRPATGVRDPLRAKVLYLSDGTQHMALISVDLRSSTPEFKEQIVQKISLPGLTSDNVFIAASHTHAGPAMYPERFWQMQFGVYDPAIVDIMTTSIAEAVSDAARTTFPAHLGISVDRAEGYTRNRRWSYNTEQREARGETPVLDPRLTVLRFDDMDGVCRALVVHFAAHPTILGASNMAVSAEWPGVLQHELERAFPDSVCLFLNGALGDQSPVAPQGTDEFERMEGYGKQLAALATGLAESITSGPDITIGVVRGRPELPQLTFPQDAEDRLQAYKAAAMEALPRHAEIQLLRIGPAVLIGLPGEPILEVGLTIEKRFSEKGFGNPLAVGLANDYIGYIVNETEYGHGGYEIESRSYYGPGLGAFMAEQTAALAPALLSADDSIPSAQDK